MPLNSVPAAFDDDEHTRLDKLVFDMAPQEYPGPMIALGMMVKDSDGTLDPRYQNIMEVADFLRAHPELQDKIESAYAKRSFKDIRSLGMSQSRC